jgi:transcription antitermination factor NusA-like protein
MESKKRGRDEHDDGGEKRQRSAASEQRILLEQDRVSYVIGKGGSIIKNIIRQSGAFLKFAACVEGTTKQVGTISGSPDRIGTAIELLVFQMAKYQSADGKAPSLVLLVKPSQVGLIIGKAGAIVRSVQSQSGARIQVSARPDPAPDSDDGSGDQEVNVSGNPQAIATAARALVGHLFQQPVSPPPPSYLPPPPAYLPPPPPLNPYWGPPPSHIAQGPPLRSGELEVRFALRPREVSRIIGKGGQGIQTICKQSHVKLVFDKQVQQAVGGASHGPAQIGTIRGEGSNISKSLDLLISTLTSGDDSESKDTVRFLILVPSPTIGFLLGTKGSKIKETKEQSGASINITGRSDAIWDHVSGVALQAVVIEGSVDSVTTAVKSLVSPLEDARQTRPRRRQEEST